MLDRLSLERMTAGQIESVIQFTEQFIHVIPSIKNIHIFVLLLPMSQTASDSAASVYLLSGPVTKTGRFHIF